MPQQTHWEDHRRPFETGNVDQNTPVVLVLLQPWIRCSLHLLYYVYMGERTEPRSNYKMLTNVEAQARLWRLVGNVQSLFPLVETSAKCQGLQARWHCHSFKALVEHHTKDQVLQIARLGHSMGPRGRQLTQMFNSQCFPCFAWPMFVPILSGSIPKFFKSSSSSVRKTVFCWKKDNMPRFHVHHVHHSGFPPDSPAPSTTMDVSVLEGKRLARSPRGLQRAGATSMVWHGLTMGWAYNLSHSGGSINWRYPNSWMVYNGKSPTKMDDLGVCTPILGNPHLCAHWYPAFLNPPSKSTSSQPLKIPDRSSHCLRAGWLPQLGWFWM